MPPLIVLPQFTNRNFPAPEAVSILIQGLGAVGLMKKPDMKIPVFAGIGP